MKLSQEQKDAIKDVLHRAAYRYEEQDDYFRIYLTRDGDVSFAQLELLSALFNTKRINLGNDEGFVGSDVTGGTPDERYIAIWPDK